MDLKEEAAIGDAIDTHWYYISKAKMMALHIKRMLPKGYANHILDVGAGGGWFSRWILKNGLAQHATCVDPGYPEDWEEKINGRTLSFKRSVTIEDCSNIDLVLMMDVLEHVDEDSALLSEYLTLIAKGTPVFVTVRAFNFLWSAHDEFLEHRRRYTLSQLKSTIENAGAHAEEIHFYFGAIFPLVAAIRLIRRGKTAERSDMRPAPNLINGILKGVLSAERTVMRLNRLAGVSAVGICRR